MTIPELITRSHSIQFYQDCNFLLESKHFIASENKLELIFSINQTSYDIPVEYEEWKVVCSNFLEQRGLDNKFLLPYIKMDILKEHPLLWRYQEGENECYIKGAPQNLKEFYGGFAMVLEKTTGNWIKLTDVIRNLEHCFKEDKEQYTELSDSMRGIFESLCKKYNLEFRVKRRITGKEKGYFNRPQSELLIFGNEQVSSNYFDAGQPYIMAENFHFTRIK